MSLTKASPSVKTLGKNLEVVLLHDMASLSGEAKESYLALQDSLKGYSPPKELTILLYSPSSPLLKGVREKLDKMGGNVLLYPLEKITREGLTLAGHKEGVAFRDDMSPVWVPGHIWEPVGYRIDSEGNRVPWRWTGYYALRPSQTGLAFWSDPALIRAPWDRAADTDTQGLNKAAFWAYSKGIGLPELPEKEFKPSPTTFPFGRYRGYNFCEIPVNYLDWYAGDGRYELPLMRRVLERLPLEYRYLPEKDSKRFGPDPVYGKPHTKAEKASYWRLRQMRACARVMRAYDAKASQVEAEAEAALRDLARKCVKARVAESRGGKAGVLAELEVKSQDFYGELKDNMLYWMEHSTYETRLNAYLLQDAVVKREERDPWELFLSSPLPRGGKKPAHWWHPELSRPIPEDDDPTPADLKLVGAPSSRAEVKRLASYRMYGDNAELKAQEKDMAFTWTPVTREERLAVADLWSEVFDRLSDEAVDGAAEEAREVGKAAAAYMRKEFVKPFAAYAKAAAKTLRRKPLPLKKGSPDPEEQKQPLWKGYYNGEKDYLEAIDVFGRIWEARAFGAEATAAELEYAGTNAGNIQAVHDRLVGFPLPKVESGLWEWVANTLGEAERLRYTVTCSEHVNDELDEEGRLVTPGIYRRLNELRDETLGWLKGLDKEDPEYATQKRALVETGKALAEVRRLRDERAVGDDGVLESLTPDEAEGAWVNLNDVDAWAEEEVAFRLSQPREEGPPALPYAKAPKGDFSRSLYLSLLSTTCGTGRMGTNAHEAGEDDSALAYTGPGRRLVLHEDSLPFAAKGTRRPHVVEQVSRALLKDVLLWARPKAPAKAPEEVLFLKDLAGLHTQEEWVSRVMDKILLADINGFPTEGLVAWVNRLTGNSSSGWLEEANAEITRPLYSVVATRSLGC